MKPSFHFSVRQLLWVTLLAAVWCALASAPGLRTAMGSWIFPGALGAGMVIGIPIAIAGALAGEAFRGTIAGCGVVALWMILSTPA